MILCGAIFFQEDDWFKKKKSGVYDSDLELEEEIALRLKTSWK